MSIRFENNSGIEITLHADLPRPDLARAILDNLSSISATAIHLLETFMKDRGVFEPQSVEVFELQTRETGDFVLSFSFIADHDAHKFNYTYFDVYFMCQPLPGHPFHS